MKRVLLDGRVFSTAAYDRGMGRYVHHIIDLLEAAGHDVTVLLFRNCYLPPDHPIVTRFATRFADYDPERPADGAEAQAQELHECTAYLSALIELERIDVYIDATPFIGPLRLDLFGCAVLAVCYDFIPLKHPDYYLNASLTRKIYFNGLARLAKADHITCISEAVRDDAAHYLARAATDLSVVTPTLESRYAAPLPPADSVPPYLFAILGSHKSKNPEGSLAIYRDVLRSGRLAVRINAPKHDQRTLLQQSFAIPEGVAVTASVSDEEKFSLQRNATVVAHLSLEEGFGIPLLEALFLHRKVIALDTPVNREFFNKAAAPMTGAVFLLDPITQAFDIDGFHRFLDTPANDAFFAGVRDWYERHWQDSPAILDSALAAAATASRAWGDSITAKIFSSIPGSSCGVADYSVAYARSAPGNIVFFFSEGEQENLSYLPNLRACTYLDFERFNRSRWGTAKGLFNFAFSSALHPGITLLRRHSRPGDVLLVHERRYFDGLRAMQIATGRLNELMLEFTADETSEARSKLARDLLFHPVFNGRNVQESTGSPLASAWLRALPVRTVSHLPPAVMQQMHMQAASNPGSVINDLADLEPVFDFAPLGIDDRHNPAVMRAANRLRTLRRVQQDDIVVGHAGLILNDLKRLWDVVEGFLAFAAQHQAAGQDGRRLFFFLIGKVIDHSLYDRIVRSFTAAGLQDRLIHSNPADEHDFDAEIAACSALACFRVQTRGQLSHVYVRALSLGVPVLVNERSGYGYDDRTTIADDDVPGGLAAAIAHLFDRQQLLLMRQAARQAYQSNHRGDASLRAILDGTRP